MAKNDEFHQKFEYLIDQTIRKENSEICLTADITTFVTTRNCSEKTSLWAIDGKKKQKVVELNYLLCLTAVKAKLMLQSCERSPQQSYGGWNLRTSTQN